MHRFRVAFADSLSDRFVLPKGMWRLALGLLLGFLAFPLLPAFLAQTTSTIEGTVSDRQGLAISGAEESVTANTLAVSRKTTTDATGNYQISALPAGIYRLTVSHAGFSTQEFKDLEMTLNRTLKFDVSLDVGTVAQKVVVSAEMPLLETTASSQGATIVPSQIVNMPINGRNYLDLMQLVPGVACGGAWIHDKAFWFGSAEGIHENRQLNFVPPPNTPQFLIDNEETYNEPTTNREVRLFAKFDQVLSNHHITEQMNYTNVHVNSTNPLSAANSLPSTRTNLGDRNLLLGFSDVVTFGNSGSPFILNLRGQYRDEPTLTSPAHPQAGPNTTFNLFSSYTTGGIFGDQGEFSYGAALTPSTLDQKYGIF